jgi:hypothetical protein
MTQDDEQMRGSGIHQESMQGLDTQLGSYGENDSEKNHMPEMESPCVPRQELATRCSIHQPRELRYASNTSFFLF